MTATTLNLTQAAFPFFDDETAPSDVLTAEVDGVVAGYLKVGPSPPLSSSHAQVLEVGGLAVDPARQGEGIGQQLVEAAVLECTRRAARKLTGRTSGS